MSNARGKGYSIDVDIALILEQLSNSDHCRDNQGQALNILLMKESNYSEYHFHFLVD
jgi:hypothetical protein